MTCIRHKGDAVSPLLSEHGFSHFNPFPNDTISDDNFKFGKNVRKLSKRVENTVGKGEIARYKQFLLFPQCFQKTSTADT